MFFTYVNSAGFVPSDIADLMQWLDASDASTITQVAGLVSQWDDKSTNGNNVTQGTGANQPVTGLRNINTLNVLDFNGTVSTLTEPAGMLNIANGAYTIFVTNASDVTSGLQELIGGQNGGGGLIFTVALDTGALIGWNGSGRDVVASVTRDTAPHTFCYRRSAGTHTISQDGATPTATDTDAINASLVSLSVGSESGVQRYFNGVIAEIVIYSRLLSNSEINQVGNYLATKWGIAWTDL